MGIIFIIGAVQAFWLEFILLKKKNKSLPDKILAVWMFFIGIHLFLYYLYHIDYYYEYPVVMGLMVPLPLVQAPFLFIYVSSLTLSEKKFSKLIYLHFITAALYYLSLTKTFFMSKSELLAFIEVTKVDPPINIIIFSFLIDISGLVYIPWAIIKLKKHQKTIGENFSYTESINLVWLRNLIYGMSAIWTAVFISVLMEVYLPYQGFDYSIIIYTTVVIFVFIIGYYGTRQGVIFTEENKKGSLTNENNTKVKYEKSSLKEDKSEQYLKKLLDYMEAEKPYLESKITLPQLAEKLDIHYNYLSQIINEKLNQNFYEFVNGYRVEEFKSRIQNNNSEKLTLLGHALESGFSSKSSFNEVFKKTTGTTPSKYLKELSDKKTPSK